MVDYNTRSFEADCEYAFDRLVNIKKGEILLGEWGATDGWSNIEKYIIERYRFYSLDDRREHDVILAKWKNKAVIELRSFYNDRQDKKRDDERRKKYAAEAQEAAKRTAEKAKKAAEEAQEAAEQAARKARREAQRLAEENRRMRIQQVHSNSLQSLMSAPYNFTAEQAEDFIEEDGEIDTDELTHYVNNEKNKKHLAQKVEQWEVRKGLLSTQLAETSLKCHDCGNIADKKDKFCRKCGSAIRRECPSCKKRIPISYKFCSACGIKL